MKKTTIRPKDYLNSNLKNKLIYGESITSLQDLGETGLYYINNSDEMPESNCPYIIYAYGTKGKTWNYPLLAFNSYSSDRLYFGRYATSDGSNYTFEGWKQIQIMSN